MRRPRSCSCAKLKITPDLIIGDFDSYKEPLPENIEIMRSIPEKDDTDTMLAVRTVISRGAEKIRIYGALGGRSTMLLRISRP